MHSRMLVAAFVLLWCCFCVVFVADFGKKKIMTHTSVK
jgi:hypothetical protein